MKTFTKFLLVAVFFAANFQIRTAMAQCDTIAMLCTKHITRDFISDGQQYRALLLGEETSEFHATFFGGSTYRVAGCSGLSDGNLIFRLFDEERNLLFSNSDFKNSAFWDFQVNSTLNCIIEAQLDPTMLNSGCAVLLIGFRQ